MSELLSAEVVGLLAGLTILLILLLGFRPQLLRTDGGRLLGFFALLVLPIASMRAGVNLHLESSKTTEFCLSCHSMEPYGESLLVADPRAIPADHFQNRRTHRDKACFECHTHYTMFGDMTAKMNGLKHLYVHYTGQTPDKIELYSPYQNRECLYCHVGARRFEDMHAYDMAELVSNDVSCMTCHGSGHDVHDLEGKERWGDSIQSLLAEAKAHE